MQNNWLVHLQAYQALSEYTTLYHCAFQSKAALVVFGSMQFYIYHMLKLVFIFSLPHFPLWGHREGAYSLAHLHTGKGGLHRWSHLVIKTFGFGTVLNCTLAVLWRCPIIFPTFVHNQGLNQEPPASQPSSLVYHRCLEHSFFHLFGLCGLLPVEFAVMDILWW